MMPKTRPQIRCRLGTGAIKLSGEPMSAVYDQKKIDALASELMEPQQLAGGGAIRRLAEALKKKPVDEAIKDLSGRNEIDVYETYGDDAIEQGWSDGSNVIVLDKIYIDPENRGQGIGRQILSKKIEELAEQYPGYDLKLLAEPLDESTRLDKLIEFYESMGFDVGDYQDGMSGVPMEMTLRSKPKQLAGGGAIRKAAKAVRQAADSDLDMSTEARMQRAAEQGFNVDMPVYHGTGEDFLEFDPLKIGKTDEGWFGQGFYFSPIPEIANQYAAGRSPNVQQVYLRAKNPYDWRKNEGASLRLGTAEERYAKTKEILEKGYDAVDVYSDRIKIGQDEILPDNVFLAIVQRAQRLGDPVMPRAMIEQALKSGMDYHDFARRYGNDIASMMPVKKTLMEQVVFDPANIRSVNAAFDPANRRSANILATAAGGTIGLSALRQLMPQEERPIE